MPPSKSRSFPLPRDTARSARQPAGRAKSWSRPLADLVGPAIDPVLARQGFSEADLILHWDDIVGERLAANSRPIKLQWPPRQAGGAATAPATLVVRVEGPFALEMQHLADPVLARVNAHLGWRCVGRLALRQGPIEHGAEEPPLPAAPTAAAVAEAEARAAGIGDDALRAAMVRLGSHVLGRRR